MSVNELKKLIPLRSLEQVMAALATARAANADKAMARLMLRHGRLTDEARNYVAREYGAFDA